MTAHTKIRNIELVNMEEVHNSQFKSMKEVNFDQCFREHFYMELHGLLNFIVFFKLRRVYLSK